MKKTPKKQTVKKTVKRARKAKKQEVVELTARQKAMARRIV